MIHRGNNQRWPEYHTWASLCIGMGVRTYLELGCGSAGHMELAGMRAIAIDLVDHGPCRHHLHGNTHDPAMVDRIVAHFGGFPDAIFIDAGHEYAEARADFDQWFPWAGMVVGFHDILMGGPGQLWSEVSPRYPSIEIIGCDEGSAYEWQRNDYPGGRMNIGGIGVIFKERP